MRHHLRKALEVYAERGLLETVKSGVRYLPIELNNAIFWLRHGEGTRVIDEDWDNLFILDGCRYDMFQQAEVPIEGTLESRISLGSSSEEFLEQNFVDDQFHDTVYVNANPFVPRFDLDKGVFHTVINCLDEWNSHLQTVPPEPVVAAAERAYEEFPDKRIIVHFMQPHVPFIGEKGQKLPGGGWTIDKEVEKKEQGIWKQLQDSPEEIDLEEVWIAYEENLKLVLDEVAPLVEEWNGKSVISADHGNLVGERLSPLPTRRMFSHPYGVHTEPLVKVPWFVVDDSERREITEDPPVDRSSVPEDVVEDHLEALGYR
jgi:hypothetical protein